MTKLQETGTRLVYISTDIFFLAFTAREIRGIRGRGGCHFLTLIKGFDPLGSARWVVLRLHILQLYGNVNVIFFLI